MRFVNDYRVQVVTIVLGVATAASISLFFILRNSNTEKSALEDSSEVKYFEVASTETISAKNSQGDNSNVISNVLSTKETEASGKLPPNSSQETNNVCDLFEILEFEETGNDWKDPPSGWDTKILETCEDYKNEFVELLTNLNKSGNSEAVPILEEVFQKMLKVCKLPTPSLKECLRAKYERKRDSCLGAQMVAVKDLDALNSLLKGLKVVDPSYTQIEPLEELFAKKYVPLFLEPFQKLESDPQIINLADIALTARSAFPAAQAFASRVSSSASKALKAQCSHPAFEYSTLASFLENFISKTISTAKDGVSDVKAMNYVRIILLINPKSHFAFPGLESFEEIRSEQSKAPLKSYLEIQPTKSDLEFLRIEVAKNMSVAELETRKTDFEAKEKTALDAAAVSICRVNISLLKVLMFAAQKGWSSNEYIAWRDSGFRTFDCPEFIKWVEYNHANHPYSELTVNGYMYDYVREYHKHRMAAAFDEKEIEEQSLHYFVAPLVWRGLGLLKPITPQRNALLTFLQSGKLSDMRKFEKSLQVPLHEFSKESMNAQEKIFEVLRNCRFAPKHFKMSYSLYVSSLGFRPTVLFESPFRHPEKWDDLERFYKTWRGCVQSNSFRKCTGFFMIVAENFSLNKHREKIRKEYEEKFHEICDEKTKSDDAKEFIRYMAVRAYINMREYVTLVKSSELETKAKQFFGLTSLPKSRNELSVETFKKDPELHQKLAEYLQVKSYEQEWKNIEAVMQSLEENKAICEYEKEQLKNLLRLKDIFKLCEQKKCSVDFTNKKLHCTDNSSCSDFRQLIQLEGPIEKYVRDILDQALKTRNITSAINCLEQEEIKIKSLKDVSIYPEMVENELLDDFAIFSII